MGDVAIPTPLPLRGGSGQRHDLFQCELLPIATTDKSSSTSIISSSATACLTSPLKVFSSSSHVSSRFEYVFFDNGTISSWVEPGVGGVEYKTRRPVQLRGIGGKTGPVVSHDALLRFRFRTADGTMSPPITVSAGVCQPGTFPAKITLGSDLQRALQTGYRGRSIVFGKLPGCPTWSPMDVSTANFGYEFVATTNTSDKTPPPDRTFADNIVSELRSTFPSIFGLRPTSTGAPPTTAVAPATYHSIELDTNVPIAVGPRRYSPQQELALREFVRKAESDGLLNKSKSPYACAAHLVPKRGKGSQIVWRFCVDYRPLNNHTVKNAHPLPNVMDQIQRAAGHRFYVFLDLKDGFWQIQMNPKDRHKTAFSTPFGLFEWNVMPFGLSNAPATFQAFITEVLDPCADFVAGILDDVAIWGESVEELLERTKRVLARFALYGLQLNIAKCRWFVQWGRFLGFIISAVGITSDPDKIAAILKRPPPNTATEVRSFLNAAGYFRHFIRDFSAVAASLYSLTGLPKNAKVSLSSEQTNAWQKLCSALTQAPLLRPFDWTLPVVLETDSSQIAVGAVLLQPHLNQATDIMSLRGEKTVLHPVAYMSKKLDATQSRYSAQERELLAVVEALKQWKYWLQGSDITVVTDHDSLKLIRSKTGQPPRILRFLSTIEHYNVNIVYRAGKLNVVADWLSRPTTVLAAATDAEIAERADSPVETEVTPTIKIEDDDIDKLTDIPTFEPPEQPPPGPASGASIPTTRAEDAKNDIKPRIKLHSGPIPKSRLSELNWIDVMGIYEYLLSPATSTCPPGLNSTWVKSKFLIHQGTLFRRAGQSIMAVQAHNEIMATAVSRHIELGHCSAGSLISDLSTHVWHPSLPLIAYEAIRRCAHCQLMRKPDPTLQELTPVPPAQPLARWGIDHTTFDKTPMFNAIDYATGWAESAFVPNMTATTTIGHLALLNNRFGPIRELIADNAQAYVGQEMTAWLRKSQVVMKNSTPAHPRTNGRIERYNGIIKAILARLVLDNPGQSLIYLLMRATHIYNRRPGPHGYSPYQLLYGVVPRRDTVADKHLPYAREFTEQEDATFVRELVQQSTRDDDRNIVASIKASQMAVRARLQEQKALIRVYETGDWVLRVRQRGNKMQPYYDGPWAITAAHSGNTYSIASPGGIQLPNRYNGALLFPAYVQYGQPERSLWYGSKTELERDRARQLADVGAVPARASKQPRSGKKVTEIRGGSANLADVVDIR